MSTHTQIVYQIVFSTKNREKCLLKPSREEVFSYMRGVLWNKKCHPYIINGVEDHVHILTHLHPTISLSSLVKEVKVASHAFIKDNHLIPSFNRWAIGYGAFTYSKDALPNLIRYIKNQEAHHRAESFESEYRKVLEENGVEFDERFLFE